jgi:hypothetical protein
MNNKTQKTTVEICECGHSRDAHDVNPGDFDECFAGDGTVCRCTEFWNRDD